MTTPETTPVNPPARLDERSLRSDERALKSDERTPKSDERPAGDVLRSKTLLADCLAPRPGSALAGKTLDLNTALGTLQEGRTRYDVVAAYWRAVRCGGEYLIWLDYDQQLQAVRAAPQAAAELKTAQAASEAALHEAELTALAAQQDLAAVLQWSGTAPPMPVDTPHVGAYNTLFDELFRNRTAPVRARMLHQTLPLRRQVYEARAVAAVAALEAWNNAMADYRAARLDLARLVACLTELRVQRIAFVGAVCQYNQQIADYVLNVVAPPSSAADVVAMLIKTGRKPAADEKPPEDKRREASAPGAVGPTPAGTPPPSTFATPPDSAAPRGDVYKKRER